MTYRRKLIEVALPLDAINKACAPETENPFLGVTRDQSTTGGPGCLWSQREPYCSPH